MYAAKFGVGAVHVMLLCGGDVLDAFASVFPCAQQRVPLSDAEVCMGLIESMSSAIYEYKPLLTWISLAGLAQEALDAY